MDDNLKEVIVLAITTLGTVLVAYLKMRGPRRNDEPSGAPPLPPE